jgi:U2 small nuclear ribonucleoprotein B''
VAGRPGIAFVEFDNDAQAGVAMGALSGFKLDPTHAMQVNYAKQ